MTEQTREALERLVRDFTRYLRRELRGVKHHPLRLVELSAEFATDLANQFDAALLGAAAAGEPDTPYRLAHAFVPYDESWCRICGGGREKHYFEQPPVAAPTGTGEADALEVERLAKMADAEADVWQKEGDAVGWHDPPRSAMHSRHRLALDWRRIAALVRSTRLHADAFTHAVDVLMAHVANAVADQSEENKAKRDASRAEVLAFVRSSQPEQPIRCTRAAAVYDGICPNNGPDCPYCTRRLPYPNPVTEE